MLPSFIDRTPIKTEYLDDGWEGSLVDLLDKEEIPFNERLRIIIEQDLISDRILRLYAVWCARRVVQYYPAYRLGELLDKVEEFANGDCSDEDVRKLHWKIQKLLPDSESSVQLQESKAAAFSTMNELAKNAAREASFHSLVVLSHYNERTEIQRKHFWKIKDLILENLTSGEVAFILKNTNPKKTLKK